MAAANPYSAYGGGGFRSATDYSAHVNTMQQPNTNQYQPLQHQQHQQSFHQPSLQASLQPSQPIQYQPQSSLQHPSLQHASSQQQALRLQEQRLAYQRLQQQQQMERTAAQQQQTANKSAPLQHPQQPASILTKSNFNPVPVSVIAAAATASATGTTSQPTAPLPPPPPPSNVSPNPYANAYATAPSSNPSNGHWKYPTGGGSHNTQAVRHKISRKLTDPVSGDSKSASQIAAPASSGGETAPLPVAVVNGQSLVTGQTDESGGEWDGAVERRMKRLRLSPTTTTDQKGQSPPTSPPNGSNGASNGSNGHRKLNKSNSNSIESDFCDMAASGDDSEVTTVGSAASTDDDCDEHIDTERLKRSTALIPYPSAAAAVERAAGVQKNGYRLNVPLDAFGRPIPGSGSNGNSGSSGSGRGNKLVVYKSPSERSPLAPAFFDDDTIDGDDIVFPLDADARARAAAAHAAVTIDESGKAVFGNGRVIIESLDDEEAAASGLDTTNDRPKPPKTVTTVLSSSHSTVTGMDNDSIPATKQSPSQSQSQHSYSNAKAVPSPRAPALPRAPYAFSSNAIRRSANSMIDSDGSSIPTAPQHWKTDVFAAPDPPTTTPIGAAATAAAHHIKTAANGSGSANAYFQVPPASIFGTSAPTVFGASQSPSLFYHAGGSGTAPPSVYHQRTTAQSTPYYNQPSRAAMYHTATNTSAAAASPFSIFGAPPPLQQQQQQQQQQLNASGSINRPRITVASPFAAFGTPAPAPSSDHSPSARRSTMDDE